MNSLPEPAQPQVAPAAPVNDVDWGAVASRLWRLMKNLPWAKIGLFSVKAVFWAMAACAALVAAVGTVCVWVLALAAIVEGNSESGTVEDSSKRYWLEDDGSVVDYNTGHPY
jgi:hypothetical protein